MSPPADGRGLPAGGSSVLVTRLGRLDNPETAVPLPVGPSLASYGMAAANRAFVDSMPQRFPTVRLEWSEGNHGLGRQHPESVALHIKRFVSELETPTRT